MENEGKLSERKKSILFNTSFSLPPFCMKIYYWRTGSKSVRIKSHRRVLTFIFILLIFAPLLPLFQFQSFRSLCNPFHNMHNPGSWNFMNFFTVQNRCTLVKERFNMRTKSQTSSLRLKDFESDREEKRKQNLEITDGALGFYQVELVTNKFFAQNFQGKRTCLIPWKRERERGGKEPFTGKESQGRQEKEITRLRENNNQ